MVKTATVFVAFIVSCVVQAATIDTTNSSIISAFQSGATVANFESIVGRTPQAISSYTAGDPVSADAFVFDEVSGVQFSVGGMPGTNSPALYQLTGGIAGDAKSGTTVLGPVNFDFQTHFEGGSFLEIFFPTKVSKVGFWLNPSLGNVKLIAADTNFAFSRLPETNLEIVDEVHAGNFVGIERPTADIGGLKVLGIGPKSFTIDDFTFGAGASSVPEPDTSFLIGTGLIGGLVVALFRRRNTHSTSHAPCAIINSGNSSD